MHLPQGHMLRLKHGMEQAWTEVNDLSSTRALTGSANFITTNTEALSFGGTTDGGGTQIATTEEWTAADFEIKSVTTS